MKIKQLSLGTIALLFSGALFAQSAVIRGEYAAGTYVNLKADSDNFLYVNCPGCTGASAPTGANNADAVVSVATGLAPGQNFLFAYNGTTWDRLQVDGSKYLKVNCASGCSGGSFNNNADAVATSATNGQSASWLYGFNGTTWDRLGVDGSKNLKVTINAALPTGTNVIGHVIHDTGSTTVVTGTVAVTQSGTWTVQPGNTANTTAWKVDGSAVTQPVSAASLPLPTLASTSTKQSDGSQKTQIVDGSGNVIASTSNNLNVQCANCSGSGVSAADGATWTQGTSLFAPGGGVYNATPLLFPLTDGKQGTFALTVGRALFTSLQDETGASIGDGTARPLFTQSATRDGSGNTIGSTSGALNIQCINCTDNATSAADASSFTAGGTLFTPSGGFYQTTATSNALTNGQKGIQQFTAQRAGFVNLRNSSGTELDLNSGNKSAATLRVVLATDQPALTNKLLVTPDSVALPANQSVNVSQVGGTAVVADPCQAIAKISLPISQATSTQIISGTSAKKTYICSIMIIAGAAENVAVTAGTGTVCATGAAAIIGSTTVANGMILAANAGFVNGNGAATIAAGLTNADNICILQSGSVRISGVMTYVQQ